MRLLNGSIYSIPAIIALMLFGCSEARFDESDMVGRWTMVEAASTNTMLILTSNNIVEFRSINAAAIGLSSADPQQELPPEGTWRFDAGRNLITFRFVLSGVTYNYSGRIDRSSQRLYFTIGDPDDMKRIYFRRE